MFLSRKSLPRRTFLRGVGAAVALPLLDAMVPAATALAQTPARPIRRFGSVYVPQGAIMDHFTPATTGSDFEFTPILRPIERFRDQLTVVSGLGSTAADAGHAPGPIVFLSGTTGKRTESADIRAGVTIDQLIAREIGQTTMFPSLELATEDFSGFVGACDVGWACAYMNTVSWANPTTPLPMELNPRVVFERMFGGTGTPEQRRERRKVSRSVLDAIGDEVSRLQGQIGAGDRQTLTTYLDNVREIERRIERAEQNPEAVVTGDAPVGVPAEFEEHISLMFDLMVAAFQSDITRVVSFMMARELSQRTYPAINCLDPHHAMSHHRNEPLLMAANERLQIYHYSLLGKFLDKLKATPDGDGNLLDQSVIYYGSGMSDSNLHSHQGLPLVVVGGGAGKLRGDRHLMYPAMTPLANLHVSFGEIFGLSLNQFGDSTGRVDL